MAADKKKGVLRSQLIHSAVEQSGIAASHAQAEAENSAVQSSDSDKYAIGVAEQKAEMAATRSADLTAEVGRQAYYRIKAHQGRAENAAKPSVPIPDFPGLEQSLDQKPISDTSQKVEISKREIFCCKVLSARAAAQHEGKSAAGENAQNAGEKLKSVQEIVQSKTTTPGTDVIRKKRISELHKNFIKKQAVKKHFEKKSANQVAGVVLNSPMPRLPELSKRRAMQGRLASLAKQIWDKIKAALGKVVKAAVSSLLALLGAGGVVLSLAMVIGAAAAIIGSPMGILFADESGDPNAIPVAEIVQETNREFAEAINEIVNGHPECDEVDMHYDYEDGHTWASYWPEVLAVFAVNTNLNGDSDVVVIDEAKKQQIKGTFWEMHIIESEVEQVEVTPAHADEDDPEIWHEAENRYILHITISSRTVEELAADKHFTADQMDILQELLSDEMRPTLAAMCGGGIGSGDGTLQWPLPGYTNITTNFGAPDAFGRPGHRGIDIAAGEGTPIHAAHSGTVLISGWNDSYGNTVLLDNGAGLSTRYAHMITTAVAAGETVTAGQVIGYVGSTGDSTGNHLHFEVKMDGVLADPLLYVNG